MSFRIRRNRAPLPSQFRPQRSACHHAPSLPRPHTPPATANFRHHDVVPTAGGTAHRATARSQRLSASHRDPHPHVVPPHPQMRDPPPPGPRSRRPRSSCHPGGGTRRTQVEVASLGGARSLRRSGRHRGEQRRGGHRSTGAATSTFGGARSLVCGLLGTQASGALPAAQLPAGMFMLWRRPPGTTSWRGGRAGERRAGLVAVRRGGGARREATRARLSARPKPPSPALSSPD